MGGLNGHPSKAFFIRSPTIDLGRRIVISLASIDHAHLPEPHHLLLSKWIGKVALKFLYYKLQCKTGGSYADLL